MVLVGFLHLVVLYGYQGADVDAQQLALTEQLFDAALGELSVVARGQPCMLVGDFNVEPTKIPCLAKGISALLWVDFEEAWSLAAGLQPAPTCKRDWFASGGHRRDFMVGCPLAAAAVLSCKVQPDRWIARHLAVGALFDCSWWTCRVTQPVQRTPLWPASWLPAVDKGRGSKSVEVQRVWEVYYGRLQFMSQQDSILLSESLDLGDVSRAWLVWSRAAEVALADAFRFSGGPIPTGSLVLGRESALFRIVRLGGHEVKKARGNAADALDAVDVFLYLDSSIARLLDMRRRFEAVMDVLGAMVRYGVSLARSVELTAQWSRILADGPLYPVTFDDLSSVRGLGIGAFHQVVSDVHHRLSDFIHAVVVHRRDEAIREWRNWIREDPMVHPYKWLRPDLVPLLLFCCVILFSLVVVLGFWQILPGLMRNSKRPGFPTFVVLGKGRPALRNSVRRLTAGCPCFLRCLCLNLLVRCLLRLYIVRVPLLVAWMVGVGGN